MSKNYIFRKLKCNLTKEQTADLCFKSVKTVTRWDEGQTIPPEYKRLMRMSKGRVPPPKDYADACSSLSLKFSLCIKRGTN